MSIRSRLKRSKPEKTTPVQVKIPTGLYLLAVEQKKRDGVTWDDLFHAMLEQYLEETKKCE